MSSMRDRQLAIINDCDNEIDEALRSIETIRSERKRIVISCYLTKKFNLIVNFLHNNRVEIIEEYTNKKLASTTDNEFIAALKRAIYTADELIAELAETDEFKKHQVRKRFSKYILLPPEPPVHMDLPTWDEETKTWYDAEY
jgi:hypothetical protein